jgi:hypothetical protein
MPHFQRTSVIEMQECLAEAQERAAAAFDSELSTESDPKRREWLADKARRCKNAARFYRETSARLRQTGELGATARWTAFR